MKKKYFIIIIFLLPWILAGCSEMKPQEVSTFTGISIARRSTSKITPIPDQLEPLNQDSAILDTEISETPSPVATNLPKSPISTNEAEEAFTETPFANLLPVTEKPGIIQETQTVVGENAACLPANNRNYESRVIQLINDERKKEGYKPLSEQTQLTQAARSHSEDMACNQFFSHFSPTNGDVGERMTAIGYGYSAIGENIAAGYATPEDVVQGWLNSPGHRANILNGNFTQVGVGYVVDDGSGPGIFWTLLVGTP